MACQVVADALTAKKHEVDLVDASQLDINQVLGSDLIILTSPSWGGGEPHEDFTHFMDKTKDKTFSGKQFAIFGLGDSSFPAFCGAVDTLEAFVKKQDGKLLVDSLRIDGYFANQTACEAQLKEWAEKVNSEV